MYHFIGLVLMYAHKSIFLFIYYRNVVFMALPKYLSVLRKKYAQEDFYCPQPNNTVQKIKK